MWPWLLAELATCSKDLLLDRAEAGLFALGDLLVAQAESLKSKELPLARSQAQQLLALFAGALAVDRPFSGVKYAAGGLGQRARIVLAGGGEEGAGGLLTASSATVAAGAGDLAQPREPVLVKRYVVAAQQDRPGGLAGVLDDLEWGVDVACDRAA